MPFDTWLEALKQSVDSSILNVEKNPAVRLLDFHVGVSGADKIPRAMSSKKTWQISETLRNVGPVSEEWVRKWMSQWRVSIEKGTESCI